MVQREMPFQYIRKHGLFHEDMMVYYVENGQSIVNWQYVDLVCDHWISIGIRPFVELSFMPYGARARLKLQFRHRSRRLNLFFLRRGGVFHPESYHHAHQQ